MKIGIKFTKNTYAYYHDERWFQIQMRQAKCQYEKTYIIFKVEITQDNVDDIYQLIAKMYNKFPNEKNKLEFYGDEYDISCKEALRELLYMLEDEKSNLLWKNFLKDIIKKYIPKNLEELCNLSEKPFSGILYFDNFDARKFFHVMLDEKIPDILKRDCGSICISNRIIPYKIEMKKTDVIFRNCIITNDIDLSRCVSAQFYSCIVTGKITCVAASKIMFGYVNAKSINIYNSSLKSISVSYCKIYRFVLHSSSIDEIRLFDNKFMESYMANLELHNVDNKINMSQFNIANFTKKKVDDINNNDKINIKNESDYYLTFLPEEQPEKIAPEEIVLDTIDTFLMLGDLENKNRIYSVMMYKKALYSNTKWRRVFVFLTGAFYIPLRWIVYLVLSIVIFAIIYNSKLCEFKDMTTNLNVSLNIVNSLYLSVCQTLGTELTQFSPIGISKMIISVQSFLKSAFVTNLFLSIVRKYMRDNV